MNVNFTDTSQTDMSCTKFIINSQLMICTFYSTVKKKPEHVAKQVDIKNLNRLNKKWSLSNSIYLTKIVYIVK